MGLELWAWALPRLSRLLPIYEDSLKEIIEYTTSLSKEEGANHLKNLLGDSPQALDFISSFNSRRPEVVSTPTDNSLAQASILAVGHEEVPSAKKKLSRKTKAPLHRAGPVRQPEGYGDVSGGYHKSSAEVDYIQNSTRHQPNSSSLSNALALSQQPAALQPKLSPNLDSPSPSSSRDPSPPRQRLPPSASGLLISDMPNVRAKQSKRFAHSGTSTPHKPATTTTSSINDLTAAIASLELSTNPSLATDRRKCPCNASIHPLFTPAPNCLACGKIICALEGLQPCSFCDSPILSREQVQSMIRALKEERGQERMAVHNANVPHSGRATPSFAGLGGNTPESSGDEASAAAAKARAHRDKLLAFQKENAQRTKVHDEAADYDVSMTPGATQWMSPLQRAAALKKQKRYLREMEEQNKPEWEKRKTVMSMSIKGGKVVKTYEIVKVPAHQESEEVEGEDAAGVELAGPDSTQMKERGSSGSYPLLADGGLYRPIWKVPDGEKGRGEGSKRPTRWRRVQDDDDDNEQWILDGGLHTDTKMTAA